VHHHCKHGLTCINGIAYRRSCGDAVADPSKEGATITLYSVKVSEGRLAASRTLEGVRQFLEKYAPGRYVVEELTYRESLRATRLRDWGWAIKQDDGQVALQPSDEPSQMVLG
jgi:hypothetical protein